MARKTVTVITATVSGRRCVHFCDTKLRGADIWFPVGRRGSNMLFDTVEFLMTCHRVAHNVVSIEKIRHCGMSIDYQVTYNEWEN